MTELVYAGQDVQEIIAARWPTAKFTDASDGVHEDRFEVEVPCGSDEFYVEMIRKGLALHCFAFNLMMGMTEGAKRVRRWMDVAKAASVPTEG